MNPITIVTAGSSALNKIRHLVSLNTKMSGNISLTEVTQSARVEPLTIISQDCINIEYMPEVMQTCHSLFTGYYMQAVALIADIKGITAARTLDKLNPNAGLSPKNNPLNKDWMYGYENYKFSLPSTNQPSVSLESMAEGNAPSQDKKEPVGNRLDVSREVTGIGDFNNLAVGKMFTVAVARDGMKLNVPVSIRLLVTPVNEKSVISMLTLMTRDSTFKERWHAWRSGRITFWKDLILANDLIKEAKRMMQNDKEGVISEIFQRSNNAKLNSVFGNNGVNLASASNIYVISKEVADEIERKSGTRLNNFKSREEMLSGGYCMILAVVDKTWDRVTFYHRGITMPTVVGVRDMKIANKGSGPDVMEIMKALMFGNNPSI